MRTSGKSKKVIAKRAFELEDQGSGISVIVNKGDTGDMLRKDPVKGYTIIINDKTIYIATRKLLRYLFKYE